MINLPRIFTIFLVIIFFSPAVVHAEETMLPENELTASATPGTEKSELSQPQAPAGQG